MIERLSSKDEVRAALAAARREGKIIGCVPTMGALHAGHLSLVHAACMRTDLVVVSIFVNPTQFGPGEDFEAYPRSVEEDLLQLAAEGVEVAFTPSVAEMYGDGSQTGIDPGEIARRWEGEVRPGHFGGVALVVTKLLSVVKPDAAFFGEKDFQQLRVIEGVARDLDLGCAIVGCPIVRGTDGLALSSRNAYLSAEERASARAVPAALAAAEGALARGERDGRVLEAVMRDIVAEKASGAVSLDYAAVVDSATLEPVARVSGPARALIAARVGATRLIDNCELLPKG